MDRTKECISQLLDRIPELNSAYEEHIRDNGELLPHVFLGGVTRFVVREMRSQEASPSKPVQRIIEFFEQCMASGDEQVIELISVSFLENLLGEDDVLPNLKKLMGPNLVRQFEAFEK
jgi:hypothetical protein